VSSYTENDGNVYKFMLSAVDSELTNGDDGDICSESRYGQRMKPGPRMLSMITVLEMMMAMKAP